MLALMWVALILGTLVTGSGPHAGDAEVARNGLDGLLVTQLHAGGGVRHGGGQRGLVVRLRSRAAALLLGGRGRSGRIGVAQYRLGLPIGLVAAHLLGASLAIAAGANLMLSVRGAAPRLPTPAAEQQLAAGAARYRCAVDQPTEQHLGRTAYPARSWAYASTTVSSQTPTANSGDRRAAQHPAQPRPHADKTGAQITDWAR